MHLSVYDLLGREVLVLVSGELPSGTQMVRLDTGALPAGQYVYRLRANGKTIQKMLTVAH